MIGIVVSAVTALLIAFMALAIYAVRRNQRKGNAASDH